MNRLHPHGDPDDIKRLTLLMLFLGIGLLIWHYTFEAPRQRAAHQQAMQERMQEQEQQEALGAQLRQDHAEAGIRAESQARLKIESPLLEGAVALQGGRINYLVLKDYKETTEQNSPPVTLLQPNGTLQSYFVEFGWLSSDKTVKLPDSRTVWTGDQETLTPTQPVTLSWDNGEGLHFSIRITLTDDYLFEIEQTVRSETSSGGESLTLLPYGFINRTFEGETSGLFILHEGPLGVLDDSLSEISYDELDEKGKIGYPNAKGWLGITDKYWLTALIPHDGTSFTGNFKAYRGKESRRHYQVDYLGKPVTVENGGTATSTTLLFAGAKKLDLLDRYAQEYDIPLFDRAVDLGVLYFLTKPMLLLLTWLYQFSGDFGLAIILLTVLVKSAMYPLANKSYIAMNEMKRLQPKLMKLKERYGDDKMQFNQEMMKIYKKEKINPAAGCLPLLVQIPVFFALYKVLFVTIEMRHASFYGLIEDLSARDPSNLFTLFGLWESSPLDFAHLGILPILMAVTMWAQQQLNPKPTDPVQAKVMAWLPWIFMIILAGFPAGLLVYWVWSNMLSIAQQWSIKSRYQRREKKREAALEAKAANDD